MVVASVATPSSPAANDAALLAMLDSAGRV